MGETHIRLRLAIAFLLLAAPAVPLAASADPVVACPDARGCPDLTIDVAQMAVGHPQRRTFAPDHCAVEEGAVEPGTRDLMVFSTTVANVGEGDLSLGHPPSRPEWYEWSPCHGHWHFIGFSAYRLWTVEGFLAWDALRRADPSRTATEVLDAHPELREHMRAARKQGVCPGDIYPAVPGTAGILRAPPDPLPKYSYCWPGFGPHEAGISRGWSDLYNAGLDGQWVDVTGIPTGTVMILENEVNPEHRMAEMDLSNNRAFLPIVVVTR